MKGELQLESIGVAVPKELSWLVMLLLSVRRRKNPPVSSHDFWRTSSMIWPLLVVVLHRLSVQHTEVDISSTIQSRKLSPSSGSAVGSTAIAVLGNDLALPDDK